MMKYNFIFAALLGVLFSGAMKAQRVGINIEEPMATLDIKTTTTDLTNPGANESDKVLRFSTKPTSVGTTEDFVFLVGKEENSGYNLRKLPLQDFIDRIKEEIPMLRRITVRNSVAQNIPNLDKPANIDVNLDEVITNTSITDYRFDDEGNYIEILKDGVYNITAWVGVAKMINREGDILISMAKAPKGSNNFVNFKRMVISRSNNAQDYVVGDGVGGSFSFITGFKAGDKILMRIANASSYLDLQIVPNGADLSIERVVK